MNYKVLNIRIAVFLMIAILYPSAQAIEPNHLPLLSHTMLMRLCSRVSVYLLLPKCSEEFSDTMMDGRLYKRLRLDPNCIFRGREPLDNNPYDTASYRATNKIGILWTWVTSDRADATIDDALYMSLWDKSRESNDPGDYIVSMEIVKIDNGDNVHHLVMIDDQPVASINWEGLGHNNPFVYRWTIHNDAKQPDGN